MKLVMTLLVRDEEEILDTHIGYHLAAGVDLVLATDHESRDGTVDVLERYARQGVLHLFREQGPELRQSEWVTRMARMAAREFGADWVINSDADEFWWPTGGDLKHVLAQLPARFGVVGTFVRTFLPRAGDAPFHERMVVRYAPSAAINDPAGPFRVNVRLAHRGSVNVVVGTGNATVSAPDLVPLRPWAPLEVFHFPIRSFEQFEQKFLAHYETVRERRRGDHVRAYEAAQAGRLHELFDALCVDEDRLRRGLEDGSLAIDTRLRDALRTLNAHSGTLDFPRRDAAEEVGYAVEATVLHAGELVRRQLRADELEHRLRSLERRRLGSRRASSRPAVARSERQPVRAGIDRARRPAPARSPKIVQTLLVRDEADVIDAHIKFHLDAGVDLVIVTDHRSVDGTTEILRSYAREGYVRLFVERSERISQSNWVTRMARLAASEYGADWVINSDADEFWWPSGGSLKHALAAVPAEVGLVRPLQRPFVPRPDDGGPFSERMTIRLAVDAPINDPSTPYRPVVKAIHRGHPGVAVGQGNHSVSGIPGGRLDCWPQIELFHLPLRSRAQVARKHENTWRAWHPNLRGDLARARLASELGRPWAFYDRVVVDDEAARRGLAEGTLVEDTRLRDALHGDGEIGPPHREAAPILGPAVAAGRVAHAVEASCFVEAELVRLQRWADGLAERVDAREGGRARRASLYPSARR